VENIKLTRLSNVSTQGSFVGICGAVGSGKSTFLKGLAGSIVPTGGRLHISGRVAYVAQTPWIFRGTLRENVVFGEMFDSLR
jgi:ABC-type polysaccharide/polyol phosphate transport system ATPase subunit